MEKHYKYLKIGIQLRERKRCMKYKIPWNVDQTFQGTLQKGRD